MSHVVVVGAVSYPQTASNRTRSSFANELLEYVGGRNDDDAYTRAAHCIDEAVRVFNEVPWKFNRMQQTITLTASTSTYSLNTDVRNPLNAVIVDSNSKDFDTLAWIDYPTLIRMEGRITTSGTVTTPNYYTMRNLHNVGQVTFYPSLGPTFTYPTVRLEYHRRTALAVGDDDRLNVPMEVEQAMFEWALWRLALKIDSGSADPYRGPALTAKLAAFSNEHRDFADIALIGV